MIASIYWEPLGLVRIEISRITSVSIERFLENYYGSDARTYYSGACVFLLFLPVDIQYTPCPY